MSHAPDDSWSRYLSTFHAQRPGITEDVLTRAASRDGLDPYQWIALPIPASATTLDLACGSGPTLRNPSRDRWVGVDRSPEELARARAAGSHNVIEGVATALPFGDATFDGVVCSMAIMLIQPLEKVLDEVFRVLRPNGIFVVTMPGRWPLTWRDVVRYARLVTRLGLRRLSYPNEQVRARSTSTFESRGFQVIDDVRRRFGFFITSPADGALFVRSLYLPHVDEPSIIRGERLSEQWVKSEMGIPLRRLTMRRR